jgi:precorrin-4/cobalt-precorrin-4 C11-methyltransferase
MTIYFIGAGPGDPELITVKGQRLIRSCPVILYAGSLVPEAVLQGHSAEQVVNTAELNLGEIVSLLREAHERGQDVARVHSGDPSLYGASASRFASCAPWVFPSRSSPASPLPPPAPRCWKAS